MRGRGGRKNKQTSKQINPNVQKKQRILRTALFHLVDSVGQIFQMSFSSWLCFAFVNRSTKMRMAHLILFVFANQEDSE